MTMRERVAKAVKEELAKKSAVAEQEPTVTPVILGGASYTKMLGKSYS